jgi:hypothetical protein
MIHYYIMNFIKKGSRRLPTMTAYELRQPGDTEDKPKQSPLEKPKTHKKPIAKQTSFFYPSSV